MEGFSLVKTGKPLEKLIDVISKGAGILYKPASIRKEADAEAYRIRIIEKAKSLAAAERDEIEVDTYIKVQERMMFLELKRQENIETVSEIAAQLLSQEDNISSDPVDDDWIDRFFRIIENVSNEEMQELWGKILADEVKQPNSFSLRTLETLRNISKSEAIEFVNFAQYALIEGEDEDCFVFYFDKFLQTELKINGKSLLILKDAGLIVSERPLSLSFFPLDLNDNRVIIKFGKKEFRIKGIPRAQIESIVLSQAGIELASLVESKYNEKYIEKVKDILMIGGTEVDFVDSDS